MEPLFDNVFRAEKILKRKRFKGEYKYFVKWKGYGKKDCTWEPETNILDQQLIDDYLARMYQKQDYVNDMKSRLRHIRHSNKKTVENSTSVEPYFLHKMTPPHVGRLNGNVKYNQPSSNNNYIDDLLERVQQVKRQKLNQNSEHALDDINSTANSIKDPKCLEIIPLPTLSLKRERHSNIYRIVSPLPDTTLGIQNISDIAKLEIQHHPSTNTEIATNHSRSLVNQIELTDIGADISDKLPLPTAPTEEKSHTNKHSSFKIEHIVQKLKRSNGDRFPNVLDSDKLSPNFELGEVESGYSTSTFQSNDTLYEFQRESNSSQSSIQIPQDNPISREPSTSSLEDKVFCLKGRQEKQSDKNLSSNDNKNQNKTSVQMTVTGCTNCLRAPKLSYILPLSPPPSICSRHGSVDNLHLEEEYDVERQPNQPPSQSPKDKPSPTSSIQADDKPNIREIDESIFITQEPTSPHHTIPDNIYKHDNNETSKLTIQLVGPPRDHEKLEVAPTKQQIYTIESILKSKDAHSFNPSSSSNSSRILPSNCHPLKPSCLNQSCRNEGCFVCPSQDMNKIFDGSDATSGRNYTVLRCPGSCINYSSQFTPIKPTMPPKKDSAINLSSLECFNPYFLKQLPNMYFKT